jgi:DNA modification methylase
MDFGEWDWGKGIDMEKYFTEAYRILKKGGTIIMFYDIFKIQTIKEIAEKIGFKQPRIGFWDKTNAVPVNARINYLSNAREYFISFCKGKKGTFNSYYDKGVYQYPIVSGKERVHPTQKPYGLICDLINVHSNPGDVVLDTFSGSGVTMRACKNLNRNGIGIEIDEKYYQISKSLIK